MNQILTPIPIFLGFAVLYGVIAHLFFSIYWEKFWLGILILPLVAVPYYYSSKGLYVHFWPGMWAQCVWILLCAVMAEIHGRIRRNSILKLQESRDREGGALSDSLDGAIRDNHTFGLYLRPFRVTGNIPTSLPGTHYTTSEFDGVRDFEGLLEDALRDTVQLVALGRPMETYGAGRILTDDANWQAKIIPLMQAAQTIFIIPSNRPGTLWELEYILHNNLMGKCIFIMPPTGAMKWTKEPDEDWQYDEALVDQARDWTETARALESIKIDLPPYEQSGALFTISPSGELNRYAKMALLLPKFTGSEVYLEALREAIGELRAHSVIGAEHSRRRPIAPKAGFFEHEGKQYDIRPDGFEITMFPRTWRGGIGCFFLGCFFVYLFILSWGHWKTMLLFGLESGVATILVNILLKVIGAVRAGRVDSSSQS